MAQMQTIHLSRCPSLLSGAAIGGKQEADGPLAPVFDRLDTDPYFGQRTFEQAESAMQGFVLSTALKKAGLTQADLGCICGGDLLNQCIATSFNLRRSPAPFYGIYSACATMGEGLSLASLLINAGYWDHIAALTSSHFCTAERQYRTPLPYGSQRCPTAQWTATAAGCAILGAAGGGPYITHVTCGKIVDLGIKDVSNMGAAMAPAAADTISAFFRETGYSPTDFDQILTGDLGKLGAELFLELTHRKGLALEGRYFDCGLLLYDLHRQDMHCGASGAGCSAAVCCGYLLDKLRSHTWNRVLFAPTGALLSPVSAAQGESIPAICHAVCISNTKE